MSGSVDVHTYLYNLLTILRSKGLNHSGGGSLMAEVPKHLVVMESHVKYFPCYEKALLVEKKNLYLPSKEGIVLFAILENELPLLPLLQFLVLFRPLLSANC